MAPWPPGPHAFDFSQGTLAGPSVANLQGSAVSRRQDRHEVDARALGRRHLRSGGPLGSDMRVKFE